MNPYRQFGIVLLAGALLLAGFAGQALALTEACTNIANKATLTFNYGGGDILLESSEAGNTTVGVDNGSATTFNVATKVDLAVAAGAMVSTVPGATDKALTFSVTNVGNDIQRYALHLYAAATGQALTVGPDTYNDNFDVTTIRVYTDTNSSFSPALDDGETLVNGTATADGTRLGYTADVAGNNGVIYVHVVADIPSNRTNGDDALYALRAVTHQRLGLNGADVGDGVNGGETTDDGAVTTNGCGNVIVLADNDSDGDTGSFAISGGGTLTDIAGNGDGYAVGVYTVASAAITVTKVQETLWDPVNGNTSPKPIPGAYITYTMTITNNGAAPAILSAIVDDLQAELDLDLDLFDGTDMTPGDGPYASAAGDSVEITARAATTYYTADDTDSDGVAYDGNPGGLLTVYFTEDTGSGSVLPEDPGNHAEGELKTDESVVIKFNVIIK